MTLIFIVAALGASLQATPSPSERFNDIDRNNDGRITQSEITTFRTETFERLDRNRDGYASPEDAPRFFMRQRFNQALDTLTDRFDADRDGRVARHEFVGAPAPLLETADTNGDGAVSRAEMDAAAQAAGRSREP